jgi:hypothetical protein
MQQRSLHHMAQQAPSRDDAAERQCQYSSRPKRASASAAGLEGASHTLAILDSHSIQAIRREKMACRAACSNNA